MLAIGKGLKDNRCLLGIHVRGNEGEVDSLGFIKERKGFKLLPLYNDKGDVSERVNFKQ